MGRLLWKAAGRKAVRYLECSVDMLYNVCLVVVDDRARLNEPVKQGQDSRFVHLGCVCAEDCVWLQSWCSKTWTISRGNDDTCCLSNSPSLSVALKVLGWDTRRYLLTYPPSTDPSTEVATLPSKGFSAPTGVTRLQRYLLLWAGSDADRPARPQAGPEMPSTHACQHIVARLKTEEDQS